MNGNSQSFVNHQERVCKLYGICGKDIQCPESHQITQFGLHCLNKEKENSR